jgi:diacylglycerol O-acyltransferase / wax synthase
MAEFMRSSDAFSWSMERDPGLRSTIVTLVLLDRSPDWGQIVDRFRTAADAMGGNRVTLMRFDVPVSTADAAQRIGIIHERAAKARNERSLPYTQLIAGVLNLMPRWYVGAVLRNVDFVASDVPGIPVPVALGGASVRMQYAFSPTIGAGLNVTLLSYVDTCALGINVDTGAIPDFDVFYDCLVDGFDEVLALAT